MLRFDAIDEKATRAPSPEIAGELLSEFAPSPTLSAETSATSSLAAVARGTATAQTER